MLNTPSQQPSQRIRKAPGPHEVTPLTGPNPQQKSQSQSSKAKEKSNPEPATPTCARRRPVIVEPDDTEDEFLEDGIQAALSALSNTTSILSTPGNKATPPSSPRSSIRLHPADIASPAVTVPRSGPHSTSQYTCRTPQKPSRWGKQKRAEDVWKFFDVIERKQKICILCKHKFEASNNPEDQPSHYGPKTSSGTLRKHLYTNHLETWVNSCDALGIEITAEEALPFVKSYHGSSSSEPQSNILHRPFSKEGFTDAIVQWIVSDDQSLNVIENTHLHAVFLMLRSELKEGDIPGRKKIQSRIMELWDEHLDHLEDDIVRAVGKINVTMDIWTDLNMTPYMAVTGHWIKTTKIPGTDTLKIKLRTELLGFHRVPGRHDGEHLGHAFIHILDRISAAKKVLSIFLLKSFL
ncbi:hypothetical protein VKT23_009862 [Stygiomarasmius scandens]|uniref:BED-type domain-containing protein n=1 Tax=Marasmiellus scandens TaxID=2682957 RepID=A0ABR1JHN1_9AGAR